MKRIYPDFTYGPGPRDGCWWDETAPAPDWPILHGDMRVDVTIVGGGFTGLSAALYLAEAGVSVAVLEANEPGWGASGRNGGFCCLGGAKLSGAAMTRRFGPEAAAQYDRAELEAVELVSGLLDRFGIDADRHSQGETVLAHRARDMKKLRARAARDNGVTLIEKADLAARGMNGPFHGALTTPVGFGLNPRKYLFGLADAAAAAGARLFRDSPVSAIRRNGSGHDVTTPRGQVQSEAVLIATNGYSSEDLPDWLAGRYVPMQSTVLVTHPLTGTELEAQGWTTDQIAYDTRNLLHYFRLMPDRRFLFGMRGGLISSNRNEQKTRARTRRDFERMFPAWRGVPSTHTWSGMVCLARNRVPFVGPVPGQPGLFAGLAYHGNGVAMGSFSGQLLAKLVLSGGQTDAVPAPMRGPMRRFPLGSARRLLFPAVYLGLGLADL